ncbi:MAG: hypothetical protein ABS39_05055 [Acidovorax sp. SCN 65-28]|nr:MAG: hypothetical protein ABS39_05055 [Acidovorax sp. SCN 65-28]OJT97662.1 MAG: hypothetical protein BGN90_05670 [Acidovorax sp. 65-7]
MLQAMQMAGLAPAKALDLVPDGKLRRYRVEGDKSGSTNGWYVLHSHPILAGAFGSWKTGESHNWHEVRTKPPTPEEQAALRRHLQAAQAARVVEQGHVHAEAQAKAARLWRQARPATNAHPYLERKRIGAIGIRQLRDMLLIPARDVSGTLHTLQFIGPDGSKRFLSGGRIAGCYYAMGRPVDSLLLCEGYATAATVFQATGVATAAVFNCGNLMAVARALRSKFPRLRIVVCADNDAATPGNPGLTKATEAARAVGGFVAVPRFEGVRHGV